MAGRMGCSSLGAMTFVRYSFQKEGGWALKKERHEGIEGKGLVSGKQGK